MSHSQGDTPPRVFLLEPRVLVETRRRLFLGEPDLMAADDRLLQDASQILDVGPFSVVDKESLPPSGDERDYMSLAPYWWPNEGSADGLPYVFREDQVDPNADCHDRMALNAMSSAVNTLALAYYFSDHELFAAHAALLLRTWFLDENTGMNPHLDYGHGIPGRREGACSGIIEALPFSWLVDAVGLLGASPSWTSDDQEGLESWFSHYLSWLLDSAFGRERAGQPDHQGILYDVQVASSAFFCGRTDLADDVLNRAADRIGRRVGKDGLLALEPTKPHELEHCAMSLVGLFDLATLAEGVGLDLWNWETSDGRSIKTAFYWFVETLEDGGVWPGAQIEDFDQYQLLPLLRRGAIKYRDAACEDRIEALEGIDAEADRTNLLYPKEKMAKC